MSRDSREKMRMTADLVRRGATVMKEPCPTCGGVQVRYHGKVICTNHDNLSGLVLVEEVTYDSVTSTLRALLLSKVKDSVDLLEEERDLARQDQIVSLLAKYVELLQKLPEQR